MIFEVYTFYRVAKPRKRIRDIQRLSNFEIRQLLRKALAIAKNGEIKQITPYLYQVGEAQVLKHGNQYFCLVAKKRGKFGTASTR